MFKKVLLTIGFLLFAGILIFGAINRTEARLNLVSSGADAGRGQGENLAEAQIWQSFEGAVTQSDTQTLTVAVPNHSPIVVHGRALSFTLSLGFVTSSGDPVRVEGFEEGGEFKVARLTNLMSGLEVQLYDAQGRPGWRGQSGRD